VRLELGRDELARIQPGMIYGWIRPVARAGHALSRCRAWCPARGGRDPQGGGRSAHLPLCGPPGAGIPLVGICY